MPSRPSLESARARLSSAHRPSSALAWLPPSQRNAGIALPRWPLAAAFVGYPLWWLLGIGDLAFPIFAFVMIFFLFRFKRVQVPSGFGIWLLFLLWMICSAIEIDTIGRLIGFTYRGSLYFAVTVLFVYLYNARSTISARFVMGVLTTFWLIIVAGGYLGVFFPLLSFTTPLSLVIPDSLKSNELIAEMIYRRVTQYNPDSYLVLDPRPSAPFLYTNGWGNAYSMLMPFVIAYLIEVRRQRRFWWLLLAVPISFVPAFLTLNRGMFLGLGLALVYVAIRLMMRGNFKAIAGLIGLVIVVAAAVSVLPVEERLTSRVETSTTTEDRSSLYGETFVRTLESPVFGYGAPRPSESAGAPSAGTQGQLWMVMFSHGFPGAAFFVGWLAFAFFRSLRARTAVGLAANTVLLVILLEIIYYGVMTSGLAIAMVAAALTMRAIGPQSPPSLSPIGGIRKSLRPASIDTAGLVTQREQLR